VAAVPEVQLKALSQDRAEQAAEAVVELLILRGHLAQQILVVEAVVVEAAQVQATVVLAAPVLLS
jgi:hypothetical protein